MNVIKSNKGQGLIEYLILVAFMAIACIGVVRALNHTVNSKYQEVDWALRGVKKSVQREKIDDSLSKKRTLKSFINGVGDQREK